MNECDTLFELLSKENFVANKPVPCHIKDNMAGWKFVILAQKQFWRHEVWTWTHKFSNLERSNFGSKRVMVYKGATAVKMDQYWIRTSISYLQA